MEKTTKAQRDASPRLLPGSVGAFATNGPQAPLTRELIGVSYRNHLSGKLERHFDLVARECGITAVPA